MRGIENRLFEALSQRTELKVGKGKNGYRDEVTITEDGYEVALWGHIIAERKGNRLELNECGYPTMTTASRLNIVCMYEHLPLWYRYSGGGFFEDTEGNGYRSGHIIWDFSENRVVEE